MQKFTSHRPAIPKMQTLRSLMCRKNLLNLPKSNFLSSSSLRICPCSFPSFNSIYCFQRSSYSWKRSWEDESVDCMASEGPKDWAAYDPLPDHLLDGRNQGEELSEGRSCRRGTSSEVDSSDGELTTKPDESRRKKPEKFRVSSGSNSKGWSNRSWEEEPVNSMTSESPKDRAAYVPFADQVVDSRIEGEKLSEGWPSRRETNAQVDSSEGDENPQVSTFYDPLSGQLTAKADESRRKKPEKVRVSSGSSSKGWSDVTKRRVGKVKVSWVCENCGSTTGQWWGSCPSCHSIGSVKRFSESEVGTSRGAEVTEAVVRSWLPQGTGDLVPQSLAEVNKGRKQSDWRIPLSGHFGMEVARVLGGGLVPGSLVLIGGDPGIGKSTLVLQLANIIAEGNNFDGPSPVIYVSGEESIEQIGNRADRMRIKTADLFLYSSTDVEDILEKIKSLSPRVVIVDSIQTVYLRGVTGSAGNIMQVKECTSALLRFAKQTNIPVLLIGHVTKTGDIAGPRILEHIVDAVLYMEGERYSSYRLLRSVKNRFGSTDELGVFEMSESGLEVVSNPSEMFLTEHYSDSEVLAGLAVAVVVDGSRTFVVEVQALCVSGLSVARRVDGVRESRADMIIAVLTKQVGLKLQDSAIFLNVVSGFKLTETAGDLAIAAAICSSFLEAPIPNDVAFIGEIGLGGELRAVPRIDKRVISVAKLGYKRCVLPKSSEKMLTSLNLDIAILGCRTLKEVINTIFHEDCNM